jgi:WD40 repeat protein/predicted Ser/Thr protein kinase
MSDDASAERAPVTHWKSLAQSLLGSEDASSEPAADGMEFGDYHLEEEIARGGMGIVYRAWQVSLSRPVALKVMREGLFADRRDVERFRQEAAAAALLRHPGIVPVYECGECEGRVFYAMEWIAGPNLAEVTRENPAPARQAAQWVRDAADAMRHAHEHGVIHRDLKPANVLLDDARRARITDFGMAQRADTASGLTLSGQMLGTPGYMAPEVAGGNARNAGAAVDIYGLGSLLFHLLTGRAPFIGESHTAILRQLSDAEPVAPRLLNPSVPRDLEIICLTALNHDPAKRYDTARAMAADLTRFLNGEPIHARPVSAPARLWKWCRRKPALAGSLAVVLLLAAGIILTSVFSARRIEGLRREAVERLYASDMRLALQNIAEGKYGPAAALVERHQPGADGEDLRGFEWHLVKELCRSGELAALEEMDGQVRAVVISPDGHWLAAGAGNLRIWETKNDLPVLRCTLPDKVQALTCSPDSRRLAVGTAAGDVRILDPSNAATPLFTAHFPEAAVVLAWHADGGALELIAGRKQWRWRPGREDPSAVFELPEVPREAGFSAGARLEGYLHEPSGTEAYRFAVRDVLPGKNVCDFPIGHERILRSFNFSDDGQWLATGDYSGRLTLRAPPFDQETHDEVVHRGMVTAVAFSPDAKLIATAGDQVIRLMGMQSRFVNGILRGHRKMISSLAVSSGGTHVLSGDQGGSVKWWKTPAALSAQDTPPRVMSSSDGSTLGWTWGETGRLVLSAWGQTPKMTGVNVNGNGLAPTRAGCYLHGRSADSRSVRWVTFDDPPVEKVIPVSGPFECCSPDGRWLVVRPPETNLPVLLDRTGQRPEIVLGDEPRPVAPAFSSDGKLCALGFRTGEARIIRPETGETVCSIPARHGWAYARSFSHDGKRLATAGFDGKARLWEVATGELVREFTSSADTLWSVALSPDGSRIAAGTDESTVILWNTANGLETGIIHLGLPQNLVETLTFTPGGKALIAHGHVLQAP